MSAEPLDIDEVTALAAPLLRAADGEPLDAGALRADLARSLPRSRQLSVRRVGRLVACCWLWPEGAGAWFVGGLVVDPRHRTAPVLRALATQVRDLCAALDVRTLESHVRRDNAASIALHARLGFRVTAESPHAVAVALDDPAAALAPFTGGTAPKAVSPRARIA